MIEGTYKKMYVPLIFINTISKVVEYKKIFKSIDHIGHR
jgi:hypothetical protein